MNRFVLNLNIKAPNRSIGIFRGQTKTLCKIPFARCTLITRINAQTDGHDKVESDSESFTAHTSNLSKYEHLKIK